MVTDVLAKDVPTSSEHIAKSNKTKLAQEADAAGLCDTMTKCSGIIDTSCQPLPNVTMEEKSNEQDSIVWEYEERSIEKKSVEEYETKKNERMQEVLRLDDSNKSAQLKTLNTLVDKTVFYTKFLKKRMDERQEEERLKRVAKAKREEKKKELAVNEDVDGACAKKVADAEMPKRSTRAKTVRVTQTTLTGTKTAPKLDKKRKSLDASSTTRASKKGRKAEATIAGEGVNADDSAALLQSIQSHAKATEENSTPAETRIINGEAVPERQPKLLTGGILRDYQMKGLEWMISLWENGLNGILGDEMGLGKTLQCIAFVCYLLEMGVHGPFYVVTPLSTLQNWVNEFTKFAPSVNAVLYHGKPEDRESLRAMHGLNEGKKSILRPDTVVITSYEICMNDRKHFQHIRWKYIIVDEGHRLKNLNCRLIQELKSYFSVNRLLLTGTPLQNNLSELWSLLNFLLPAIFDDLASFQAWFDFDDLAEGEGAEMIVAEAKENLLGKLHIILEPFLLRRLKTDVEYFIPPKKEIALSAMMTPKQLAMYKLTVEKNVQGIVDLGSDDQEIQLGTHSISTSTSSSTSPPTSTPTNPSSHKQTEKDTDMKKRQSRRRSKSVSYKEMSDREFFNKVDRELGDMNMNIHNPESYISELKNVTNPNRLTNIKINNVVMQLRKVVNHPYLLDYPLTDDGSFRIDEDLVLSSGKLMLLDRLLPALRERGHRTLIFSQMTSMLDILQDYCYLRDIGFCRLDGSTSQAEREEQITNFREDMDKSVFLLSTRAGGLGINLVSADTVIIYDSDWNPQVDLQAMDRCHRIGQTKPVVVYRLVTKATVEERIFDKAQAKRRLEKLVVHKDKFKGNLDDTSKKMVLGLDDILSVIKEKDCVQVCDDTTKVVSDDELEKLLDRSDESYLPPTIHEGDDQTHKVIGIDARNTQFLAK